MMYGKLILLNARRSVKDYGIYMATMTVCVALFYGFLSISSRYYSPDIGLEFDLNMLSDGMKLAICLVTLLLLFLIQYVNRYMLSRKQKEFAIQTVMGMEQRTTAWIFFAETFVMGLVSIGLGIAIGTLCSQYITALFLRSYGKSYQFQWMLFPDTMALTIGFFTMSFVLVGLRNVHSIRRIKVIDMLYAAHKREEDYKKSRWMPTILVLYGVVQLLMFKSGIAVISECYDSRLAWPIQILFQALILVPAISLIALLVWILRCRKKGIRANVSWLTTVWLFTALMQGIVSANVPRMQMKYMLPFGGDLLNRYLVYLLVDLCFVICGIFYLAGGFLAAWKERSVSHRYRELQLFYYGQILSRLQTTTKTMALICLTLVLSIVLFLSAPALVGWAEGYLDVRAIYDVQISTRYNNAYEINGLADEQYEGITEFMEEQGIPVQKDCTFAVYLPRSEEFRQRIKAAFPVAALSLSDYNQLREMRGYEAIALGDHEFTTQWQNIAEPEVREEFINSHQTINIDAGTLTLAADPMQDVILGETFYQSYTDVVYIFPDEVCKDLLVVSRNRYVQTRNPIPYPLAKEMIQLFAAQYPEEGEGIHYYIRTRTEQINSSKAATFLLQISLTYGALVLLVICFTILSLQQLMDANQYRYRFRILRELGVEKASVNQVILRQIGFWFGMPVGLAALAAGILMVYFFRVIGVQIRVYMGMQALLTQVGVITGILVALLFAYFILTWVSFQQILEKD